MQLNIENQEEKKQEGEAITWSKELEMKISVRQRSHAEQLQEVQRSVPLGDS